MAATDQPPRSEAAQQPGASAPGRVGLWRRRACDNCGAKMRGRFCVACGQRDRRLDRIACENCGTDKQGLFCAICGQNDRNYRRNIFPVLGEMIGETFETDSRFFRTMKSLFLRPGQLSTEFSRNRRAHYLPPFRLYLFSSLLFFLLLSFTLDPPSIRPPPGAELRLESGDGPRARRLLRPGAVGGREAPAQPAGDAGDAADPPTPEQAQGPDAALGRNSIAPEAVVAVELDDDEPQLTEAERRAAIELLRGALDVEQRRRFDDLLRRPEESVQRQIGVGLAEAWAETSKEYDGEPGRWMLYLFGQIVDVAHRPWVALDRWFEYLPVAMFLVLPFYAFLLKIFYFRRRLYYSEHLVFAMHLHTAAFLFCTVPLAFQELPAGELALVVFVVYYALALKRFYADGWPTTLVKFFVLVALHWLLLGVVLVGAGVAVLLI